jgi:dTMP kinase
VTQRGRFITVEGMDGAGKSSHIDSICKMLAATGLSVDSTREPGGTPLGETLRGVLLQEAMDIETEALLMFAARREHVTKRIEPALAAGQWVLSDRFADASFAYQASARGIDWQRMQALEQWVLGGFVPDLTLLFDLPAEVAVQRTAKRAPEDRFEKEALDFHERVRQGYWRRRDESPGRFETVDASQSIEQVSAQVHDIITRRLQQWGVGA